MVRTSEENSVPWEKKKSLYQIICDLLPHLRRVLTTWYLQLKWESIPDKDWIELSHE